MNKRSDLKTVLLAGRKIDCFLIQMRPLSLDLLVNFVYVSMEQLNNFWNKGLIYV